MTEEGNAPQAETDLTNRTASLGAVEESDGIVRCDACPVLCRIRPNRRGACDRYANDNGVLIRVDNLVLTQRVVDAEGQLVPFVADATDWDGSLLRPSDTFVTGNGGHRCNPLACKRGASRPHRLGNYAP